MAPPNFRTTFNAESVGNIFKDPKTGLDAPNGLPAADVAILEKKYAQDNASKLPDQTQTQTAPKAHVSMSMSGGGSMTKMNSKQMVFLGVACVVMIYMVKRGMDGVN